MEHILIRMDDARINRAVGAELRAARARRGWSRSELVERSGVSLPSLRRYEDGLRSVPVGALVRLISELNMDVADIDRAIRQASVNDEKAPEGDGLSDDGEAGVAGLESAVMAAVAELKVENGNKGRKKSS